MSISTTMSSFLHQQVKYFCPFYRDEEFSIKPKYYSNNPSITLLEILSDMFRRQLLSEDGGKAKTQAYWRKIIEEDRRVSVLLIFSDKLYRKYTALEKPSKNETNAFVTISQADTIVPKGLLEHFWPNDINFDTGCDKSERLQGARLKVRISRQHIHPRSIVVPYPPKCVFEDQNIIAVNKPFGVPSMGETNDLPSNEWNSILTWCRQNIDGDNNQNQSKKRDLMNRLDLDVSGLVLLGKSGAYRKKRGFANDNKADQTKTVKVYLSIIPKVDHALRIITPRLGFDKKQSKAVIKQEDNDQGSCQTSIHPLLDLDDGCHSLVAIHLEESGQRHQIRFHLSLIGVAISNDILYSTTTADDGNNRRTGVGTSYHQSKRPANRDNGRKSNDVPETLNPLVQIESIGKDERQTFLKKYVFTNGVTGFRQVQPYGGDNEGNFEDGLIYRALYPCYESDFTSQLKNSFEFCEQCGKCAALKTAVMATETSRTASNDSATLVHGIHLHSWRYFNPTPEHPMLEAELPGRMPDQEGNGGNNAFWWPVQVLREE